MEFPSRRQNSLYRSVAPTNSLRNASTPQLSPYQNISFACACIFMSSATFCPAVMVGYFLSRQRVCGFFIRSPIRNLRIAHFAPAPHLRVHKPAKSTKKHGHNRITKSQLGCRLGRVSLLQRIGAIGFAMIVRMTLQIDQQPIGRLIRRIP